MPGRESGLTLSEDHTDRCPPPPTAPAGKLRPQRGSPTREASCQVLITRAATKTRRHPPTCLSYGPGPLTPLMGGGRVAGGGGPKGLLLRVTVPVSSSGDPGPPLCCRHRGLSRPPATACAASCPIPPSPPLGRGCSRTQGPHSAGPGPGPRYVAHRVQAVPCTPRPSSPANWGETPPGASKPGQPSLSRLQGTGRQRAEEGRGR